MFQRREVPPPHSEKIIWHSSLHLGGYIRQAHIPLLKNRQDLLAEVVSIFGKPFQILVRSLILKQNKQIETCLQVYGNISTCQPPPGMQFQGMHLEQQSVRKTILHSGDLFKCWYVGLLLVTGACEPVVHLLAGQIIEVRKWAGYVADTCSFISGGWIATVLRNLATLSTQSKWNLPAEMRHWSCTIVSWSDRTWSGGKGTKKN